MRIKQRLGSGLSGAAAGAINGLFGAGGGMVLVPLLTKLTHLEDRAVFPASVVIILPMCIISLCMTYQAGSIPWDQTIPYLIGSSIGGVVAGIFAKRIPTLWLHRVLGILIIWGGIRSLC